MDNTQAEKQAKALAALVLAIADTIKELKQVPSRHLYANICHAVDLDTYQAVIAFLVGSGKVRQHPSFMLEWVGPTKSLAETQPQPELN